MKKPPTIKSLNYPAKVIIAWGEAIGGNNKIREWLGKNGYPELSTFVYALKLNKDARMWLAKNGYPHLLALIHGAEGDDKALGWLKIHNFDILYHMALAGDSHRPSIEWLMINHKDFAMVALRIKSVKDQIEDDNADPHKIN